VSRASILAAFAIVATIVAAAAAAAAARCLPPSAAASLGAALRGESLPGGWKVGSVSLGPRAVRLGLLAPDGTARPLRLASRDEGSGTFAVVPDTTPDAAVPEAVIAAVQDAARDAVDDAWVACETGGDTPPDAPAPPEAGPPPVPSAPRWLAIAIAFLRLGLLVACLSLALVRALTVRPDDARAAVPPRA